MSIWTNWDRLTDVIVTDCYVDSFPTELSASNQKDFDDIRHETKEDLDNLAKYLTNEFKINVYRPKFSGVPDAPLVPARDAYLAYGDTIYSCYTSIQNRFKDSNNYYEVFQDFFQNGYNWLTSPVPPSLPKVVRWWNRKNPNKPYVDNPMFLWHPATMFKCGDAIIVNNKGPGTENGLKWMLRNLPENTKVFSNDSFIYGNWGHIDHGWFMTDDETVFCKSIDWVPPVLRNKNLIQLPSEKFEDELEEFKDFAEEYFEDSELFLENYVKQWTGFDQMVHFLSNVLVIDSHNVMFSTESTATFDLLENMGIRCHVVPQRHSGFWEGGVHCMTLDLQRIGNRRTIVNGVEQLLYASDNMSDKEYQLSTHELQQEFNKKRNYNYDH
jgi:hypothetical protein